MIVGGAAVTGGRGSMLGTVLGVALLGAIGTGLTFLGVSAYWEHAVQGTIILAAILSERAASRASQGARADGPPPARGARAGGRRSSPSRRSSR